MKSQIPFFDPYSQTEGEYCKYTALWKAVILQAFVDLRSNICRAETETNRKKAIQWMNLNNQGFLIVCDRAEINPHIVCRCKERILKELRLEPKEYEE